MTVDAERRRAAAPTGAPGAARRRQRPQPRPVYRRYDHLVGSRTVRRPGLDAAVLRLRPGYRGLAVSLDGTGRMGRLDPRTGGRLAVLEAARNVACTGAEPLGLTDCLNFGNPEKGAIAWELVESIEGMAEACEALGIPIVSGNVSLYNETDGRAIDPTPVVGCVGLLEDVRAVPGVWREGDVVLLAGASPVALAAPSTRRCSARSGGRPARLDLEAEAALVEFLWRAAPHCSLVHDVSLGGLAVALAEAALHSGVGAERDAAGRPARLVRRGRRPGGARVRTGRGRPARRRPDPQARRRRRRPAARRRPGRTREAPVMCGVFGIRSAERDVARLSYFGLFALQHRGQEAAGIAVSDRGRLTVLRDMGLVAQVFDEEKLQALPGRRRDRAHAVLDDGLERLGERAAARPSRPCPHGRARPQRQPDEHERAAGRARRRRHRARRHLRHRGDRGADRERSGPDRGSGRAGDAAARGRLLGRRALGGEAARIPRPAGNPAALARPAGRRLGASPRRPAPST